MRPYLQDIDVATVDPNGIATVADSTVAQIILLGALTSGGDLDGVAAGNSSAGSSVTLDAALTSGGTYRDATDIARHIFIAPANDPSLNLRLFSNVTPSILHLSGWA